MNKLRLLTVIAVAVCIIVVVVALMRCNSTTSLHMSHEGHMEITPTQIDSIRSIGQWEFLSIADEEIVDTVRHGFFGDDQLSRIYYGTLRLGLDLRTMPDDWITMDHDTVVVTIPSARLLDDDFLDEARTRSFIEEGKWSEADRAALSRKAIYLMRRRCLTPANIRRANDNAKVQIEQLIRSMGFKFVKIGGSPSPLR
ncbi:MAG: DUF4230 domain-containing protein [Prevotella sp.]|nr:DUF4230 domain-containing protein [Prevotella sp.]